LTWRIAPAGTRSPANRVSRPNQTSRYYCFYPSSYTLLSHCPALNRSAGGTSCQSTVYNSRLCHRPERDHYLLYRIVIIAVLIMRSFALLLKSIIITIHRPRRRLRPPSPPRSSKGPRPIIGPSEAAAATGSYCVERKPSIYRVEKAWLRQSAIEPL